ncbi:GntR family transcriptional regulator [Streptomyces natalensis]|uniref:GntR family transcriptional regulator n=1 Tax=Streptomyces natalensis ATCC 27448 TaxID=1240678 RepID=A0A0D7CF28_9ACTN|nr:winged helix-turn-helix domain-containing protein [Streptomyces natalensis]KIZ14490.1 GntR family transcriptional regulator [Streptomyces natalensis ATCC 27448]
MRVPEFAPQPSQVLYVAVADHVAARIASGDLKVGARLPAERDLAVEYGVSYVTMRRATAVLRERGLIVTVHGRGTFVAESPPAETIEDA